MTVDAKKADVPSGSPNPSDKPDVSPNPSESVTKDDVDENGKVELADAQLALKAALKIITLDEKASKAADVTGNGKVELADAQLILKYALKIIKTFE